MLINDIRAMMEPLLVKGGDWEIREQNIAGRDIKTFVKTPPNLATILSASFQTNRDSTFLKYEDELYTFGDVHDKACRLANAMQSEFDFKPGDHAAILMRNYPEWIISYIATIYAGGIAIPMNAWWVSKEIEYGLTDSLAKIVFTDAQRLEHIQKCQGIDHITVVGARCNSDLDVANLIDQYSPVEPNLSRGSNDPAMIMYTSGTTGFPKGAMSSNLNVISALQCLAFTFHAADTLMPSEPDPNAPEQEAILLTVPLFHVTGCVAIFLAAAISNRKLVMMYKWDAGNALELIDQEKITSFTGVPTMVWEMMKHPEFESFNTSTLKSIGGGGAPAPAKQVAEVDTKFKGNPGIGYGLTETNAVTSINSGALYVMKPSSCGMVAILGNVKICDENGNDLGLEKTGEICINGPFVFQEYLNKPEATAEAFFGDYFRSGDIGYFDSDGFLYVSDRAKDMVLRAGENIYCAEVESAIFDFPNVLECTVYGLPHERLGEEVACTIVPIAGQQINVAELKAFLMEKIAKFKVPEHVFVQTAQLPRGDTGKILKRVVRDEMTAKMQNN